jgi:hypothetical protein
MESEPATVAPPQETGTPIISFLFKTVIVAGAVIAVLAFVNSMAEKRIVQIKETFGHVGGRAFWTKLEDQLDSLADPKSDLKPEKKQKILMQIRVISERWRPFIDEAVGSLSGPPKR